MFSRPGGMSAAFEILSVLFINKIYLNMLIKNNLKPQSPPSAQREENMLNVL